MEKTKVYQMQGENMRKAAEICDRIRREVFPQGIDAARRDEPFVAIRHKLDLIHDGKLPVGS